MRVFSFANAVLVVMVALLTPGAGWCADETKPRAKPEKFMVEVHIHHKPAKFNLAKKEDQEKFIRAAEDGDIDEFEIERNPMAIQYQLGLWTIVVFVGLVFI